MTSMVNVKEGFDKIVGWMVLTVRDPYTAAFIILTQNVYSSKPGWSQCIFHMDPSLFMLQFVSQCVQPDLFIL